MKKEIKLKEGDLVIYQDKTLMEKTQVVSIDKKNGTATLSNKVIITRTTNINNQFTRLDGKGKDSIKILPYSEENEQSYIAFRAYHQSKRSLEIIKKRLEDMGLQNLDQEKVIFIDKKLNKIIEKL